MLTSAETHRNFKKYGAIQRYQFHAPKVAQILGIRNV